MAFHAWNTLGSVGASVTLFGHVLGLWVATNLHGFGLF
jgi:hypothetical protein